MGVIAWIIAITFFILWLVVIFKWNRRRSIKGGLHLENWANANGYTVVSRQIRWLNTGPFLMYSGCQRVFYVELKVAEGNTRRAYVRVGGWIGGMWSGKVEVKWV